MSSIVTLQEVLDYFQLTEDEFDKLNYYAYKNQAYRRNTFNYLIDPSLKNIVDQIKQTDILQQIHAQKLEDYYNITDALLSNLLYEYLDYHDKEDPDQTIQDLIDLLKNNQYEVMANLVDMFNSISYTLLPKYIEKESFIYEELYEYTRYVTLNQKYEQVQEKIMNIKEYYGRDSKLFIDFDLLIKEFIQGLIVVKDTTDVTLKQLLNDLAKCFVYNEVQPKPIQFDSVKVLYSDGYEEYFHNGFLQEQDNNRLTSRFNIEDYEKNNSLHSAITENNDLNYNGVEKQDNIEYFKD